MWALDARGDELRVIGSWGYAPARSRPSRVSLGGAAAGDRRGARAADDLGRLRTRSSRERYPALVAVRDGSLCAVPMLGGDGGARRRRRQPRRTRAPSTPPSRSCWRRSARRRGQALERARLYERLQGLQATTAALARALTPQEVAATAAAQGAEALGADSAWVALLDEGRRSLELAHAAGHDADDPAALPLAAAGRRAAAGRGRAHRDAAVAGERGRDLRPVPALPRGPPAGAVGGAAAARRRRRGAGRDRARVRLRRAPSGRPTATSCSR